MTDQSTPFPKFYVTGTSPCPYIEGNTEQKIFTELSPQPLAYDKAAILEHPNQNRSREEELHLSLTLVGFRRSQEIVYRPACDHCQECKSVRIPSKLFKISNSQKRISKKNNDISFEIKPNTATQEQFKLLEKYINSRHFEGGMMGISFSEYKDMVENSPSSTIIREYSDTDEKLIGVALTDKMKNALSMVYSFYDISAETKTRSLGIYMILNHINISTSTTLDFVYLGYFVKGSSKMNYKMNFKPIEILTTDGWKLLK
jgi:arginine-tRNA-protein transferase